ncbi:Type II/IV secretion system protein [Pleodorina starrii]|uniref:Type II/IV secretion system protein n=1 Tax=Pleodorina starrii TaxID=330485 RepID=A0A9W6C3R1_9CHLO|nr:Type II/IV secretion system protein [Pleodorina starrii]
MPLIAGATDSGKTVFARKMLSYVSDSERMITIEDAAETGADAAERGDADCGSGTAGTRTPDMLLESTLRMRPDRLIVGELALSKLAIMALKADLPLTYTDTLRYIGSSIDVVIQTGRAGGDRGGVCWNFTSLTPGDNGDTSHV